VVRPAASYVPVRRHRERAACGGLPRLGSPSGSRPSVGLFGGAGAVRWLLWLPFLALLGGERGYHAVHRHAGETCEPADHDAGRSGEFAGAPEAKPRCDRVGSMTTEEYGEYSVDDEDQLQPEDTLDDRGVDDVLDEGFSPPEKWSPAERFGNTAEEERQGETLDQRLAQEEPEPDPYAEGEPVENVGGPEVGGERSGRLVAPDEGAHEDREKDMVAEDVGIDGAAASAEEAAMHVVEEDTVS
jgi:hypothetical protein